MILLECEQNTKEWFLAKAGLPSASDFDMLITPKGEPSKSKLRYLYRLAGESILGEKVASYQNAAMTRGIEMEEEARVLYELIKGVEVQRVGVCVTDDKAFGCSPDGLVGEEGMLEIKCPDIHTHVGYLLGGVAPDDYKPQTQGQLRVTGRRWVDFMSYFPGLPPLIVRVQRDAAFLLKLDTELGSFCRDLRVTTEKLRRLT